MRRLKRNMGHIRNGRPEIPINVRRFAWLYLGAFLIALAGLPFMPPPDLGLARATQIGLVAGMVAIMLVVLIFFFWLAVWQRRNWARWVLLVIFPSFAAIFFLSPTLFQREYFHANVIAFVSMLVEAVAFYFLFVGDARPWFKRDISK